MAPTPIHPGHPRWAPATRGETFHPGHASGLPGHPKWAPETHPGHPARLKVLDTKNGSPSWTRVDWVAAPVCALIVCIGLGIIANSIQFPRLVAPQGDDFTQAKPIGLPDRPGVYTIVSNPECVGDDCSLNVNVTNAHSKAVISVIDVMTVPTFTVDQAMPLRISLEAREQKNVKVRLKKSTDKPDFSGVGITIGESEERP